MPVDIRKPLQSKLSRLKSARQLIDRQIAAIEEVLLLEGEQGSRQARGPMSKAERRAVSERMKAYWAKRQKNPKKKRVA